METKDNMGTTEGPATPYEAPAVVYESDLEVRAGTQLGLPDPLDLTGAGK
jgi:hypothetical protein